MTAAVFQEGQQAAQAAVQQPRAVFDNLAYEGRRFAEGASRNIQQTAQSTRGVLDSATQQVHTITCYDHFTSPRLLAVILDACRGWA